MSSNLSRRVGKAAAILLTATSWPALAQSESAPGAVTPAADGAGSGVEEIVVTAQKRVEVAQKIGVALTALAGDGLKSINMSTPQELTSAVPNLRFNSYSAATVNYNIRGVAQNDYQDHLEPPIAMYTDEAYMATVSQGSLPVFDVQRVEVLRGPQGTLFGRNATGGLVRFISAAPTKELDGFAEMTIGEEQWRRFEGAIGGPLTENVQARFAVVAHHRDGFISNRRESPSLNPASPTITSSGGPDLGLEEYWAMRGTLAIQPTDNLSLTLQGRYYRNPKGTGSPYRYAATVSGPNGLGRFVRPDENPYGTGPGCGVPLAGCYRQDNPFEGSSNTSGAFRRTAYGGTLTAELDLGAVTLTSVTDGQRLRKYYYEDADGSPFAFLTDFHTSHLKQFSQEVRASGRAGAINYVVGAYYLNFETDNVTEYDIFDSFLISTTLYDVKTESYAVFGQTDFPILDNLKLVLGARYSHDRKEAVYNIFDNFGRSFYMDENTRPDLAVVSAGDVSGKASIEWSPSRDLLLYASFNRGIKSGGFSFPGFLPVDPTVVPHKAETLHSFEIGEKWTLADGRVRINSAAFHYDYKNYQSYTFVPVPGAFVTSIANRDAKVWGVETELTIKPVEALTLSAAASWMDTKVEGVQLPDGTAATRELTQSPHFSANGAIEFETPVGRTLTGKAKFDAVYYGRHSLTQLAAPAEIQPAYAVGNVRVSVGNDAWELAAFVKNVWNQTYRTFALDLSSLGTIAQAYARPRTFGASLRHNF